MAMSVTNDPLAEGNLLSNVDFLDGQTHTVALQLTQQGYTVFVDGVSVATMPSYGAINGSIGFGLDRSETVRTELYAEFDNLTVRLLE
jgi:hypothetical protein